MSTEKMTPVQFAYMKLYRNLKIQEAFYTGALQGLEQMKYSDGGPGARVDMLDPALIPGSPSRPNVRSVVQAAAAAGLLVGILGAFALEYFRRLRQEDRRRVAVNGNGNGNGHGNGRVARGTQPARGTREAPRVTAREVVTHPD